jgi:hypothetical protein
MKDLKNILTIAKNEIKSRLSLVGAAAVISLFPILFPTVGKTLGLTSDYSDVGVIAYAILLCCAVGFSLLVGASTLGSDLTNRRMSFYFVRPLSSLNVWGGKVLGALALVFGSGLITIAPSFIFFAESTKQFFTLTSILTYMSITLFFLGLGLVAGIFFRSRSYILGLDLALLPITLVLGGIAFIRIVMAYRGSYFLEQIGLSKNFDPFAVILIGISLIMIVSTGVGLAVGRTDIKKVHRALSAGLWGLMMTFVLSGLTFSQWVVSAKPKDLVQLHSGYVSSADKWIVVSGRAWGRGEYTATFLLNPKTNDYVRMTDVVELNISQDGSKAVWLEKKGVLSEEFQVVKMDLKEEVANPIYTDIRFPYSVGCELSKDGSLLLTTREKLITVFDLNNGKELSTVHIPNNAKWLVKATFLNPELVRFYFRSQDNNNKTPIQIFELQLKDKQFTQVGQFEMERFGYFWKISPDGERFIVGSTVYNGKTGEKLLDLGDSKLERRLQFLEGNKYALVEHYAGEAKLKIFSESNLEEKVISLGRADSAYVSNQLNENEIIVNVCPSLQTNYYKWNIAVVNLKTGEMSLKGENLRPMDTNYWSMMSFSHDSKNAKPYFITSKGLIKLDLVTGQQEIINNLGVE